MKTLIKKLSAACILIVFSSCKKTDSVTPNAGTNRPSLDSLLGINTQESFKYETYRDVTIDVTILAPDDTPIKNIPVSFFTKAKELGGMELYKRLSDDNGKITGTIKIATSINAVVIDPQYLGVIRNAAFSITNGAVTATLGGANDFTGNLILNSPLGARMVTNAATNLQRPMTAYSYMGSYDNQGKPNYLELGNAKIQSSFLANINASIPEGRSIFNHHPQYAGVTLQNIANINTLSDIMFTFVTEAAGPKNSLAYFTYPTNTPPQTPLDIDSLHIILPNVSLALSGGNLHSGNSILLGKFNAGTSIGFALIADGWNGKAVGNGNYTVYSLDQLNPESSASLKKAFCVFV